MAGTEGLRQDPGFDGDVPEGHRVVSLPIAQEFSSEELDCLPGMRTSITLVERNNGTTTRTRIHHDLLIFAIGRECGDCYPGRRRRTVLSFAVKEEERLTLFAASEMGDLEIARVGFRQKTNVAVRQLFRSSQ